MNISDFRLHQRRYAYMGERKVGYSVPLRDSAFRRAWAWVSYDIRGNLLGVYATLGESQSRCYISASNKLQSCLSYGSE